MTFKNVNDSRSHFIIKLPYFISRVNVNKQEKMVGHCTNCGNFIVVK